MLFRSHRRACCILTASVMLSLTSAMPACAQKTKAKGAAIPVSPTGKDMPDATIPLEPLGFQQTPMRYALAGAVVSSLHYVDSHHLLLTYREQALITRRPDDPPEDNGQMVAALLLEVPSGKVLARTEWRLFDHARYLWPMGNGVFLRRIGRSLCLLNPLAEGGEGDPLKCLPFMELPGPPSYIMASHDGRMVIVESEVVKHSEAASAPASPPLNPAMPKTAAPDVHRTMVQFLRFDLSHAAHGQISLAHAGQMLADNPIGFPLIGDGYVHAEEGDKDDWNLFFSTWSGHAEPLGDVVSTCNPLSEFLSDQEFLVVTCNGSDDSRVMTLVTRDKRELWQQKLEADSMPPDVKAAVTSGRFAISRILRNGGGSVALTDMIPSDTIRAQRVEVRDVKNGALVAQVDMTPVQRAAQNFSLSGDGLHLALIQNDVIAIYDLSPLQDLPAPKVKPGDLIFVAAPADAPGPKAVHASATSVSATGETVIEQPQNVDERRTVPTLYTPEEQAERDRKAAEKK